MINTMRTRVLIISALLSCLLHMTPHTAFAMGSAPPSQPRESEISQCDFQKVLRVIDGDTFETKDNDRVRLIGVDTPETADTRKTVEWFGREASKKLREWIEGETVCLREDIDKTRGIDKYGRLLRYVWKYPSDSIESQKSESFFVNAELIKQGFGFAYTRYPFQYLEDFRKYERNARMHDRGLWDRTKQDAWEREIAINRELARTCGGAGTICPEDALNYAGKHKTVRFFVEKSYDSGKAVFMNSKRNFKDDDNFTAVIFKASRHRFKPHPADLYWGKTIDVSGTIKLYDSRAEIILNNSSQIQIIQ
jgi:micrococcal nuclease